jgi:hypothetical protein
MHSYMLSWVLLSSSLTCASSRPWHHRKVRGSLVSGEEVEKVQCINYNALEEAGEKEQRGIWQRGLVCAWPGTGFC